MISANLGAIVIGGYLALVIDDIPLLIISAILGSLAWSGLCYQLGLP